MRHYFLTEELATHLINRYKLKEVFKISSASAEHGPSPDDASCITYASIYFDDLPDDNRTNEDIGIYIEYYVDQSQSTYELTIDQNLIDEELTNFLRSLQTLNPEGFKEVWHYFGMDCFVPF